MLGQLLLVRNRLGVWWGVLDALKRDAVLYATSAVFALGLGMTSGEAAQWHWGYLAAGPYALCAAIGFVLSRVKLRRISMVRVGLLGLVLLGSVAIPLGLEARWRIAQPEVSVIDRIHIRRTCVTDTSSTRYPVFLRTSRSFRIFPSWGCSDSHRPRRTSDRDSLIPELRCRC
jgi:hypothetical protein